MEATAANITIGSMLDKTVLDDIEPNAPDLNINRTAILKIIESVRTVACAWWNWT